MFEKLENRLDDVNVENDKLLKDEELEDCEKQFEELDENKI